MTIATFAGKLWTAIHTYREARAYFGKTQPSRRN